VSSASSQVTATRPLLTKPSTAAVSQPISASPSSSKPVPEHDPFRVFEVDDADQEEVVIVGHNVVPSTSKTDTIPSDPKSTEVIAGKQKQFPFIEAMCGLNELGVSPDTDKVDNIKKIDSLYQPKDETLRKASKLLREVMTKITEDEGERLKLEGVLRQRIVVLETDLKSERLARQLAERLLAATPPEDLSDTQQRIAKLERKLAEVELEKESMRQLVKAFAEQMIR